jgi:hypothetical protein
MFVCSPTPYEYHLFQSFHEDEVRMTMPTALSLQLVIHRREEDNAYCIVTSTSYSPSYFACSYLTIYS